MESKSFKKAESYAAHQQEGKGENIDTHNVHNVISTQVQQLVSDDLRQVYN